MSTEIEAPVLRHDAAASFLYRDHAWPPPGPSTAAAGPIFTCLAADGVLVVVGGDDGSLTLLERMDLGKLAGNPDSVLRLLRVLPRVLPSGQPLTCVALATLPSGLHVAAVGGAGGALALLELETGLGEVSELEAAAAFVVLVLLTNPGKGNSGSSQGGE